MEIFQFYCIIILLKIINSSNNQIYKIKFGLFNLRQNETDLSLINNIYYNRLYLNLSIGTPPQNIPFMLDIESQTFLVSNYFFNPNKSESYERISIGEVYYKYEDVISGFNSKDILNINSIYNNKDNTKKINFILGKGTRIPSKEKDNFGLLGLRIPKKVQYGVYPFFHSLKSAELINSFTWTLKYFDNISLFDQITYNKNGENIIGEFIFGDKPSAYEQDKNKYDENEFYEINTIPNSKNDNYFFWDIEFNNFFLSFKNKNKTIDYYYGEKVQIVINLSFILCSSSFFEFLKKNFFNEFLSNKICSEKKFDYYYYYIECNSVLNIESFPDISLESRGFRTIFNLTYKDLFIKDEKNNKYIFLMFSSSFYPGNSWALGTPFLRKYQFVFNEDSRTIGYYRNNNRKNDNNNLKELNKTKKIKTTLIIFLIVIFSVLFTIFGMIIQRKFFNKNRKMRANELEENFSYEGKNNNEDKKIIKDDKEISSYYNL